MTAINPTPAFRLADRCPRLALARDQRARELKRNRAARRTARYWLGRKESLVAHRELQLVRAQATNDARYIKRRLDKLHDAYRQLEQARLTLAEAEARP